MSTDSRAQWATDFIDACTIEKVGTALRTSSLLRRCSAAIGTVEPTKKCTLDKGHDGGHECNMSRDFDGSVGAAGRPTND